MGSCANVSSDAWYQQVLHGTGAQTNETLNIDKGSSVGVSGVYIYRVDVNLW